MAALCTLLGLLLAAGARSEITWSFSVAQIPRSGLEVNVSWAGVEQPAAGDWIGVYQGPNYFAYRTLDSGEPAASGMITFRPLNFRLGAYQFRYFNASAKTHLDSPVSASPWLPFALGDHEITGIHLATTGVPGEVRVSWVSGASASPVVRFGGDPGHLDRRADGSFSTYSVGDMCEPPDASQPSSWIAPGFLHTVLLRDLAPGLFYYQCGFDDPTLPRSDVIAGRAPPGEDEAAAASAPWSFVVVADMGTIPEFCDGCATHTNEGAGPGVPALVRRVLAAELDAEDDAQRAQFIAHIGDLGYARNTAWKWDSWGHTIEPLASRVPYFVSVGNHEYDHERGGQGRDPSGVATDAGWHPSWGNQGDDSNGECGVPTFHRFPMPASPRSNAVFWYSLNWRNVHLVFLSAEHDLSPGSAQYQFLAADLAVVDRTRTPWVVVAMHRPLYISEEDPEDDATCEGLRQLIEPLIFSQSVDLFLAGHFHSYQRTAPVFNNTVLGSEDAGIGATVHITVGTAGIGFDNPFRKVVWSRVAYDHVFAYGRVTVLSDLQLQWTLVSSGDGSILDQVVISSSHRFGNGWA